MKEFTPFIEEKIITNQAEDILAHHKREAFKARVKRRLEETHALKRPLYNAKTEREREEASEALEIFMEEKCHEDAKLSLVSYAQTFYGKARFIGYLTPSRFLEPGEYKHCRVSSDFARHLATLDGENWGFPEATSVKKAFTRLHLLKELKNLEEDALWELEISGEGPPQTHLEKSSAMNLVLHNTMNETHAFLEALLRQAFLAGDLGETFKGIPAPEELEERWGSLKDLEENLEIEELINNAFEEAD